MSLTAYVAADADVRKVDLELAEMWNASLMSAVNERFAESLVGWLQYVGFETIDDLHVALEELGTVVLEQLRLQFELTGRDPGVESQVSPGVALFRLCLVKLAAAGDPQEIVSAYRASGWGSELVRFEKTAREVVASMEKLDHRER